MTANNRLLGVILLGLCFCIACQREAETTKEEPISYNTHIRPILSDKCFICHGPDEKQRQAAFRLDTEAGAYAALQDAPGQFGIVPGQPAQSVVYHRITSEDPNEVMPPPASNLALSPAEMKLIKQWIEQGAVYQPHWAFIPPQKAALPSVADPSWPQQPLDYFVLSAMEKRGLSPNPQADKEQLLKRMLHDLTGLPPSLTMQDEFLTSDDPNAYVRLVDASLNSPQYGEKMALLWMDIARYADSHGYQDDGLRTMWPWRDWVIHAFNENYNYQKFITWQLAGDLLPDANKESILATGFNRNHKITQEGGVIDEEYRVTYVADRTNTFSKGILAMTYECAKCHDHKYDPIAQADYFSTFAFFNQVNEKGLVGDITLASLADPPYITITTEDREDILHFVSQLDTSPVRVMVMKDSSVTRPTYILDRGEYDRPTTVVKPATPVAILPFDTLKYPSNRLGLAQWLFDEQNPLTARVFVNLIWQEFFGTGIVATAGDFGLQGDLPTHPALLDWLAVDFRENGWDIKRLVRQMVLSATYCQSNEFTQERQATDPVNRNLSNGPRIKLAAELLKDHVLASSELINLEVGGPSVKPYQPEGLWEEATSGRGQLANYIQDHGDLLYRRGLYQFIKRTVPPPNMLIFDASNRDQCEVSRSATNTPLQALVMMNDETVLEAAAHLAYRLESDQHLRSDEDRIVSAFRKIVCRQPKDQEKKLLLDYYLQMKAGLDPLKADQLLAVGEANIPQAENTVARASLMQTIQLIYNLEESSTR